MSKSLVHDEIYDDDSVRLFVWATLIWGMVWCWSWLFRSFLAGKWGYTLAYFGRIRPIHTDAVIFAFAGNSILLASIIPYSVYAKKVVVRLLSKIHFWGWQLIVVATAVSLSMGYTQESV